jgi:hypothetical protein
MKSPSSTTSWVATGWIWICGTIELLAGLYLLCLGVVRILYGPSQVGEGHLAVIFPLCTVAALLLLTAAGCFLRQRWAPWTAGTVLVLLAAFFLIPAIRAFI